jgi:hypothetical protein
MAQMSQYMRKCALFTGYPLPTDEELEELGYLKRRSVTKIEYPSAVGNLADKF